MIINIFRFSDYIYCRSILTNIIHEWMNEYNSNRVWYNLIIMRLIKWLAVL